MRRTFLPLILALVVAAGCSSTPTKPTPSGTATTPAPPTGTEAWSGGALLLPAESPAVVEARLSEVLGAARRLKQWVVAEPAMLGEEGEETVRAIEMAWGGATAYLGVDPTDDQAWIDRGVDPTRPLFAGVYPIGSDGQKFLTSVDAKIRSELGIPPGQPVGPTLRAFEESGDALPEGTNAEILRAVAEQHPTGGLRIVIPTSSAPEFMTTISSFAEGLGFRRFPPELAAEVDVSPMERAFWSADSGVPAFAVRTEGSHAMLDVLFPRFVGGPVIPTDPVDDLEAMYADLGEALTTMTPGRPSAPRAHDQPTLAVSFDQKRMSDYVRLRGYRESLAALQATSAPRRDEVLLAALRQSSAQAQAWSVAASQLTGSALAIHVGSKSSQRVGRVEMSMFGARELRDLEPPPRFPSLGVSDRSASIGLTVAALRNPGWRAWFAPDVASDLDTMDFEVDPVASIFPALRAALVAFGAVGQQEIRSTLFGGFEELLEQVEDVDRVEVVSLAPDISGQKQQPPLLFAFVVQPDDPARSAEFLRDIVVARVASWQGTEDFEELPDIEAGTTQSTTIGSSTLTYRLDDADPPIALFGVDVDAETVEQELAGMRTRSSAPLVVDGRLEPISMLSWFRTDDPELFDPIDPDILAQRLGPLTVEFAPRSEKDADAVTLDITLAAPPKL